MRESTVCGLAALDRAIEGLPTAERRRGLVLAVSGGADSSALALLCAAPAIRTRCGPMTIASIDHGQRPESVAEVRAVAALASRLDMGFATARARLQPGASEEAMRNARFDLLESIADSVRAGAVALAHHADDLIETVVFRQQRGTGLRGLSGIPAQRRTRAGLLLIRPLLGLRRVDLVAICRAHGVATVDDPGNRAVDRARSRLRHLTLPALRRRAGDAAALDHAILAVARAAHRISTHTGRLARSLRPLTLRGDVERTGRVDVALDELNLSDRVIAELLRQIHLEAGFGAPSRSWLARAVALRRGRAGRTVAGRGRGLRLVRTRTGVSIDIQDGTRPRDVVAARPDASRTARRLDSVRPASNPEPAP